MAKLSKEELVRKARNKALKKASCFQRLFSTPDGKVALTELRDQFDRKLHVPGDAFSTHVRVGHHEVIQYIEEILEVNTDA